MIENRADQGRRLAEILAGISRADAVALRYDRLPGDREAAAALAQQADERAEAGRRAARALIEQSFPGVSWSMIERSSL